MKTLITALLLIYSCTIEAKTNYKSGDFLYVWASNGLKLRPEPSSQNQHIKILVKGSKVKVVEKTTILHSEFLKFKKDTSIKDLIFKPIEIKGNWVKIITEQNDTGYIIDNYLLPVVYSSKKLPTNIAFPILIKHSKKILDKECDGESLCQEFIYTMSNNISCKLQNGGVWSSVTYTFPKFKMEDVLILLESTYFNSEEIFITSFNKNKIEFADNGICSYILRLEKDKVILEESCAC